MPDGSQTVGLQPVSQVGASESKRRLHSCINYTLSSLLATLEKSSQSTARRGFKGFPTDWTLRCGCIYNARNRHFFMIVITHACAASGTYLKKRIFNCQAEDKAIKGRLDKASVDGGALKADLQPPPRALPVSVMRSGLVDEAESQLLAFIDAAHPATRMRSICETNPRAAEDQISALWGDEVQEQLRPALEIVTLFRENKSPIKRGLIAII